MPLEQPRACQHQIHTQQDKQNREDQVIERGKDHLKECAEDDEEDESHSHQLCTRSPLVLVFAIPSHDVNAQPDEQDDQSPEVGH